MTFCRDDSPSPAGRGRVRVLCHNHKNAKQAGHCPACFIFSGLFSLHIMYLHSYGAGATVKASARIAVELSGLVTRISQTCWPNAPSFLAFTVTINVVGLTTCTATTSCGRPCPPSKVTPAPA